MIDRDRGDAALLWIDTDRDQAVPFAERMVFRGGQPDFRLCTPTISRELRRNLDPASSKYLPHTALLAATRRLRPKTTRIAADAVLRAFVDG